MKPSIGQIWVKLPDAVVGDNYYLLDEVKISELYEDEKWGDCVRFTDLRDMYVMDALNGCPIKMFYTYYKPKEEDAE